MIHGAAVRTQLIYDRNTSDTQTTNSGVAVIDRCGAEGEFDFCQILFWEESTADTAIALVLQVEEGDTTSSWATFAGGRGGTDFTTIAVVSASQSTVPYQINVNCLGRKRYLRLKWTPGGSQSTASGVAILSRGGVDPNSASEAGAGLVVNC